MNVSQPYPNKRKWIDAEKFIVAKLGKTVPAEELTVLINKVSKVVRTVKAVERYCEITGFTFGGVAA